MLSQRLLDGLHLLLPEEDLVIVVPSPLPQVGEETSRMMGDDLEVGEAFKVAGEDEPGQGYRRLVWPAEDPPGEVQRPGLCGVIGHTGAPEGMDPDGQVILSHLLEDGEEAGLIHGD